jgi:hypothetical protein
MTLEDIPNIGCLPDDDNARRAPHAVHRGRSVGGPNLLSADRSAPKASRVCAVLKNIY